MADENSALPKTQSTEKPTEKLDILMCNSFERISSCREKGKVELIPLSPLQV